MKKIKNGNGKKSVVVIHWNLGAKKWQNKTTEIQALVDEMKPDYCYITEANLAAGLPDYETCIQGYDLNTPLSHDKYKFSRIVLLSREGLKFKVETTRMTADIASIWISVGGKGSKSVLIGGFYREFTQIHEFASVNSGDLTEQKNQMENIYQPMETGCHL